MKKQSIMVVEDERIIARDLQATLQRAGYDVPSLAASGEEAVATATRLKPDLVLMDIVLQGQMDGIIKRHKGFIEVDSEPGKGTEIRLLIPAATRG